MKRNKDPYCLDKGFSYDNLRMARTELIKQADIQGLSFGLCQYLIGTKEDRNNLPEISKLFERTVYSGDNKELKDEIVDLFYLEGVGQRGVEAFYEDFKNRNNLEDLAMRYFGKVEKVQPTKTPRELINEVFETEKPLTQNLNEEEYSFEHDWQKIHFN